MADTDDFRIVGDAESSLHYVNAPPDDRGTVTIDGGYPSIGAILEGLRAIRATLDRLVAIEEERREGEHRMDAFITQFAEEAEPPPLPKWFVRADGTFGVNEPDGAQRPATPHESARIAATIKPARRDH